MKTKRRYIVLLVALVVALCGVAGEPVKIMDARFEPSSVLIGDHFDLVIEVECEEGSGVGFPAIGPEFAEGRIELLEDGRVDTLSSEGRYLLRKNYRMTSFEPASYRLDSLAVLAASAEGIDTLYAPRALELEVQIMPGSYSVHMKKMAELEIKHKPSSTKRIDLNWLEVTISGFQKLLMFKAQGGMK